MADPDFDTLLKDRSTRQGIQDKRSGKSKLRHCTAGDIRKINGVWNPVFYVSHFSPSATPPADLDLDLLQAGLVSSIRKPQKKETKKKLKLSSQSLLLDYRA
jgi:hypothetical protein